MATRILEIKSPKFTWAEAKQIANGKDLEIFGVTVHWSANNWFRLDGDLQSIGNVIGILKR